MPNIERGDDDAFKRGSLKRRLDTVRLLALSSAVEGNPESNPIPFKLQLTGLTGQLMFNISAGVIRSNGNKLYAEDYPADPGTIQLVPNTNFPDADKLFLRPVFQNPASVLNVNDALAQDIPFGWENFTTQADEVEIRVAFNQASWVETNVNGQLVVQVSIEWNGNWWAADAVERAISRVKLSPHAINQTVGTEVIVP